MSTPLGVDLSEMTGASLLTARRALGLRQEDLAAIVGFTRPGTISEMERGKAAVPRYLAVTVRLLMKNRSKAT